MKKHFFRFVFSFIMTVSLLFSGSVSPLAADETAVREIDILIKPQQYQDLIKKINRKEKFPVLASIDGSPYINTTINTRGSASFRSAFVTGYNRFPFQISSDPYVIVPSSQNSTVKLNNAFSLYSLTAEYVALKLFEYMDYPAPKAFPVFLSFNNIDFGLYLGVEDVNEEFILHHFGKDALDNGRLYKTTDDPSISSLSSPLFGSLYLKIGDNNHDNLISLFNAVWYEDYERFFDMDSLLKYFACAACIGGVDTFLSTIHNFYFFENNGKITVIPWDLSFAYNCFSMKQSILPDHKNKTTSDFFNLVMEKPEYKKKYCEYIEEIRETFLKPETVNPIIEEFLAVVKDHFIRDRSLGFVTERQYDFITSINALLNGNIILAVNQVYQQLEEQLNGTSDYFYVPEGVYADIFDTISKDSILSTDGESLSKEICNNYYRAFWITHLSNGGITSLLVVLGFILISLLLYLSYRIPKGKRRKRNIEKS